MLRLASNRPAALSLADIEDARSTSDHSDYIQNCEEKAAIAGSEDDGDILASSTPAAPEQVPSKDKTALLTTIRADHLLNKKSVTRGQRSSKRIKTKR